MMISDENLAVIHSYLCADGCVTRNKLTQKSKYYRMDFRNTNIVLLKDFQDKFYNYFNKKPHLYEGQRCTIGSKEIYHYLTQNFGSFYSREWSMPELEPRLINIWLRAFFDCEGWVFCKRHKNRHIGLDSVNERGLNRIREELEKINIKTIKKDNRKRNIFRLIIYGKENIRIFKEKIGFLHPDKKEKLEKTLLDYVNYNWKLDDMSDIRKVMIERVKVRHPYIVRIISRERSNLEQLAKKLLDLFNIEISSIHNRKNGIGTDYVELSINKYSEVQKLVKHNLINDVGFAKINKK